MIGIHDDFFWGTRPNKKVGPRFLGPVLGPVLDWSWVLYLWSAKTGPGTGPGPRSCPRTGPRITELCQSWCHLRHLLPPMSLFLDCSRLLPACNRSRAPTALFPGPLPGQLDVTWAQTAVIDRRAAISDFSVNPCGILQYVDSNRARLGPAWTGSQVPVPAGDLSRTILTADRSRANSKSRAGPSGN